MNKQTSNFILDQKVGIWDAKFFCNEAIIHDDYFLSTKDLSFTQGISTMGKIISDRAFSFSNILIIHVFIYVKIIDRSK